MAGATIKAKGETRSEATSGRLLVMYEGGMYELNISAS